MGAKNAHQRAKFCRIKPAGDLERESRGESQFVGETRRETWEFDFKKGVWRGVSLDVTDTIERRSFQTPGEKALAEPVFFGEGRLGEATGAELVKECGDLFRRTSVFAKGGVHDGKHTDHTASR